MSKSIQMERPAKECLLEIEEVLKRYDGKLFEEDAQDILAHIAMDFEGQHEKSAARLLHAAGMDVVFYHGLSQGMAARS